MTLHLTFLVVALVFFIMAALLTGGVLTGISMPWLTDAGAAAITSALLVRWYDHK